jgi:hypothetical protein
MVAVAEMLEEKTPDRANASASNFKIWSVVNRQ